MWKLYLLFISERDSLQTGNDFNLSDVNTQAKSQTGNGKVENGNDRKKHFFNYEAPNLPNGSDSGSENAPPELESKNETREKIRIPTITRERGSKNNLSKV